LKNIIHTTVKTNYTISNILQIIVIVMYNIVEFLKV